MIIRCDYCQQPAVYVDSEVVYGQSYGMIYLCTPCNAWVGVHSGTDTPLGRLADAALREWKKAAHASFDPLWQRKMEKDNIDKNKARTLAYYWLASQMKIEVDFCHIGMFSIEQCKQVIKICADHLPKLSGFWPAYAAIKNRRYA